MRISPMNTNYTRKINFQGEENKKGKIKQGLKKIATVVTSTPVIMMGIGGAGGAGGSYITYRVMNAAQETVNLPYEENIDLQELAKNFDLNPYSLKVTDAYVTLPSKFDYLQDEIEKVQKRTRKECNNDKKLHDNYKRLRELQLKQRRQNEISAMNETDDSVLISLFPYPKQTNDTITIEDFYKLFDLKEGALAKTSTNGIDGNNWAEGETRNGSTLLTSRTYILQKDDFKSGEDISSDY